MKRSLKIGDTAQITITVTEDMCPAFDDIVVHRVYSTWSMAHHMELAARKLLKDHLGDDEEGIGSHLSVDHLAPVPVGHTVRIEARAAEIGRSTLVCDMIAYHVRPGESERIVGRGTQVQRILPRRKLEALIARAAK